MREECNRYTQQNELENGEVTLLRIDVKMRASLLHAISLDKISALLLQKLTKLFTIQTGMRRDNVLYLRMDAMNNVAVKVGADIHWDF